MTDQRVDNIKNRWSSCHAAASARPTAQSPARLPTSWSRTWRPRSTCIVPLSLLVLGDEEAQAAVRGVPVITLDGCKLACATVNVGEAGGHVAREFTVLDCYRRNKQCKPQGNRRAERRRAGAGAARWRRRSCRQQVN